MPSDLSHLGGWIDDPRGRARIESSMDLRSFRDAAPHLIPMFEPTKPIMLYRAWHDVLNQYPAYPAQQIGDCVSFGHAHANDLRQCVELCVPPISQQTYQETDTEFIYATSREVAGILGSGDGSYGAAAVKAMVTMGMVSRGMLGTDGTYSGKRAKQWGRSGAPDSAKKQAESYKLGSGAKVTDWQSLVAALAWGIPVTICSWRGFSMHRDNQGFCRRSGRWGHCMLIAGVRFDRAGACVVQSWGPNTPDGPTDLDQPDFSFWVEKQTIEAILAEDDSWALNGSPDFEVPRYLPSTWSRSA